MQLHKKIAAGLVLLAVSIGTSGCDEFENLTDINDNPNAPTSLGAQYLLPTLVRKLASTVVGENNWDLPATSLWVQQFARIQYASTDYFDLGTNYGSGHWTDMWDVGGDPGGGGIVLAQAVVDVATEAGDSESLAVGMILRAYAFHNLTDMFGDVPYFGAVRGAAEEAIVRPVYDPQSEIYDDLFVQLKSAQDMIGGGGVAGDLVFGGDTEKWRRFANSLRLRLALRLSDVNPSKAQSEAAAALADGVMTDHSHTAALWYSSAAPDQNDMWTGFVARPGDYRPSFNFIDRMLQNNDPRVRMHAQATEDGRGQMYRGMQNGLLDTTPYDEDGARDFAYISQVGAWHLRPDAPAFFMEYAEVLLLQAEAAHRGWISGNAQDLYEDGIRAAMYVYRDDVAADAGAFVTPMVPGISDAEVEAYILEPMVAWNSADGMERIHMQYWFSLFDQGVESYSKWRRTEVPNLDPGPGALAYNTVIPLRFPYPQSELALNEENLRAAYAANGGTDAWDQPVWWDVSPQR